MSRNAANLIVCDAETLQWRRCQSFRRCVNTENQAFPIDGWAGTQLFLKR